MNRFLLLALPLVLLAIALFQYTAGALGWEPARNVSNFGRVGGWLLEAVGLTAFFLLIRERSLNRFVAGLAAGWLAWIFRGPVLLATVAGALRGPVGPWKSLALGWFVLYTACGLLLAALAKSLEEESD